MAINKVKYGNNTLIDLTGTTATSDKILTGYGAFGRDGVWMDGSLVPGADDGYVYQDEDNYVVLDDDEGVGVGVTPLSVTENGTYNAGIRRAYNPVTVNVQPSLQSKSVTPTESQQTITPDSGKYGLSQVVVAGISSTYVGTGIARKSSTDLTVSGATVTVPAGYYSGQASKSVASMTLPTATATTATGTNKATISRSTATRYINIPTGYNSASAYYTISSTPNGTATTPATTITTNPTITVNSSGLITATNSKTQSVTPTVSAGYVSTGTAGTITVSGSATSQLTTKGATTYTPTTTNQTIASGTYLTGAQTISGDTNLVAENIKKDVTIFGITGTAETEPELGEITVKSTDKTQIYHTKTIEIADSASFAMSGNYIRLMYFKKNGEYVSLVSGKKYHLYASYSYGSKTVSFDCTFVYSGDLNNLKYIPKYTCSGDVNYISCMKISRNSNGGYVSIDYTASNDASSTHVLISLSLEEYPDESTLEFSATCYRDDSPIPSPSTIDCSSLEVGKTYDVFCAIDEYSSGNFNLNHSQSNSTITWTGSSCTLSVPYPNNGTTPSSSTITIVINPTTNQITFSSSGLLYICCYLCFMEPLDVDGYSKITVEGNSLIAKTVTPTEETQIVTPDEYDGLSQVTVYPIPNAYIVPSGTSSITSNGTYSVGPYANVDVTVTDPLLVHMIKNDFNITTDMTTVNLGSEIGNYIGDYAFYRKGFRRINAPYIAGVWGYAFYSRLFLESCSFPALGYISDYAFAQCSRLKYVYAPNVTTIGNYAFYSCSSTSFVSVSFPLLSSAGSQVFGYCSYLQSASFSLLGYVPSGMFYYCYRLSSVDIPNASTIGMAAFGMCSSLRAVSFPSVTSIDTNAFVKCSTLSSVYMPELLTIGSSAFSHCSALTQVSFSKCTVVWTNAFYSCSNLTSVYLPNVELIGANAFQSCFKLSDINVQNATSISGLAFSQCYLLSTISLPNVESVYGSAFYLCSALTSLILPKASYVSNYAFRYMTGVQTIVLGNIQTLGTYAFANCYNLLSLYLIGSSVLSAINTTSNTFTSTPISNYTTSTGGVYGSIFVPASLYDAYKVATGWSVYSSRFVSLTDAQISAILNS